MKKLKYALILILIISLVLGCGQKKEEIKIGAILPLTGDAAMYGKIAQNAMELAVDHVNKDGINGRNIKIIYEDTQAKADLAVNSTNKLVNIDKVNVIIGAMSSTEVLAIAPMLNKEKVVLISPAATNHDVTTAGDYIFRTIVSDLYDGTSMARFAFNEKSIKTAGVFYITEAGPKGVAEAFIKEFKELGGRITLVEKCKRGDTNFRTQISKIQQTKPDAIYFALFPKETENFIKQASELNVTNILLTHQLIDDPEMIKRLGPAANGILFTSPKLTPETGDKYVKAFYEEYKEKFQKEPQNFASNSYDAVMIVAKAMKEFGTTSDDIKKGLYKIKDYHGASGVFSIDQNGDIDQKMLIMEIYNGKTKMYDKN